MPGYHQGRPPRNKGLRYPADPPNVEEVVAVMRSAGDRPDGLRLRGLIVVLWRAGLRIGEALALAASDLGLSTHSAPSGPSRQSAGPEWTSTARFCIRVFALPTARLKRLSGATTMTHHR
jgi:hypothetical protein